MSGELNKLHRFIVNYFSLQEFKTLCFDMRINYDTLAGEELSAKSRELMVYLGRQKRLDELLTYLKQERMKPFSEEELAKTPSLLDTLYKDLQMLPYQGSSAREIFPVFAANVSNKIPSEEIEIAARRWLQRNIWVKRSASRAFRVTGQNTHRTNLNLYYYEGNCIFTYNVREKQPVKEDGEIKYYLPDKVTQLTSDAISVVWLVQVPKTSKKVEGSELFEQVISATNGSAKATKYDFAVFDKLAAWYWNLGRFRELRPWRIWPHVDKAKKLLGDAIRPQEVAVDVLSFHASGDSRSHDMILNDAQLQLKHQISRMAQRRSNIEYLDLQYYNRKLYPLICPFWIIETTIDEDEVVLVLSGVNGNVLYASVPIGLVSWVTMVIMAVFVIAVVGIVLLWILDVGFDLVRLFF